MNFKIRGLGHRPDPTKRPDEKPDRDARGILRAAPVPLKSDNLHLTKVIDQGAKGSCVANTIAQTVRASHVHQGAKDPEFLSRLFSYFVSRLYHHETGVDSGTYLRYCFAGLNKFGYCPESSWTYDDGPDKFKKMPSGAAFHDAYDQISPTDYQRIFTTGKERLDDIKRALGQGFLVAFGTPVSNDFCSNVGTDVPIAPPVNLSIAGGHAMCVVDHDGDVFRIINSWSTDWGQAGYCHFKADYLSWSQTDDVWICRAAPKFTGITR